MKSFLLVCFVAVAITATQGYRHSHMQVPHKFQDEALRALDNMEDPASGAPPDGASAVQKPPPNPHDQCDCDKECHDLHDDRLPKEIQVSTKQTEIITTTTKRFQVRASKLENNISLLNLAFRKPFPRTKCINWYFMSLVLGRTQISELRKFPSVVSWCSLHLSAAKRNKKRRRITEEIRLQANLRLLPLLQCDVLQMPG